MELKALQKRCHDLAVEKGFWGEDGHEVRNIPELLMLVVSELGEACEALRKGYYHIPIKKPVKKPDFEEWKEIPRFKGEYEASSLGRIKSNNLKVWSGKCFYEKNGRILKPGLSKSGYYTVSCRSKTYKVSWLVAEAFLGNRQGKTVNHINGDKTCDWVTNLEIITTAENNSHALNTGLKYMKKILSFSEQLNIAFRLKNGEKCTDIHKDYTKVSLSAIKSIKQRGIEKYTECFEIEIADAIIRICDMAEYLNIDLEWQIEKKLEYNKTRPKKHGKQF